MRAAPHLVVAVGLGLLVLPGRAWARPDSKPSADMYKYAANDMVKAYDSPGGSFKVHYTETQGSANAVPAGDANNNGVPDHVEEVAVLYDDVLAFYKKLGFKAPPDDAKTPGNNGGDERFDVYLLDFALKADGHFSREQCTGDVCSGYMVQENDFSGYSYPSATIGNRILGSHEFFHAVQAGYDVNQSSIISEGTAVWATEQFDNTLDDFEGFLPDFFKRTDRSLDKPLPGAVDPFSYASAIWWEFLSEHLGQEVIRKLWEDCVNGAHGVDDPDWWAALPRLLERDYQSTFAAELATFAGWNLLTGRFADAKRAWARGSGYPLVTTTNGQLPYKDDALRVFYASSQYVRVQPQGRDKLTAVILPGAAQDASAIRLLVATRGSTVGAFTVAPATQPQTVDTASAAELLVVVVNTAQSGDSFKGTLCIGSDEEVAPCLPASPADMGTASPDSATTTPMEGSGCSVATGRSPDARGVLVLLGLTLVTLRARRRTREPA